MTHASRMRALALGWLLASDPLAASPLAPAVFINEFHYDNTGTDVGEFVELAGPAGTDLTGWQLLRYNGNDGRVYGESELSGVLANDTGTGFGFLVIDFAVNGLQNGGRDGLALLDRAGGVVEFLSYEGILTALEGGAAGLISRDVGVAESSSTPVGASLQRVALDPSALWRVAETDSRSAANLGQAFGFASTQLSIGPLWPLWLLVLGWLVRRKRYQR